jgi:hypothetical protein
VASAELLDERFSSAARAAGLWFSGFPKWGGIENAAVIAETLDVPGVRIRIPGASVLTSDT